MRDTVEPTGEEEVSLRYWLHHQLRWRDLKAFWQHLLNHFQQHHCFDSAAALTLATLFALVPTLAVLYSILAMIPSLQGVGETIQSWAFQHLVPSTGNEVKEYLLDFAQQAKRLTSVGVAMLFVTAIGMLRRIEKVFNRIWCVQQPREQVLSFLRYWALLSLGPILLGMGLVVTSYVASLALFADTLKMLAVQQWGLALLPFITSWLSFAMLNWVVPNRKVPLKAAAMGGFVSALGFEGAKRLFAVFVSHFPSYQLVYGAFAFFPLFIIWIYVSWVIVLMGAVVARSLTVYRAASRGITPWYLSVFDVLHAFWMARQSNVVVTPRVVQQQLQYLSPEHWEDIRGRLLDLGWIQRTTAEGYLFVGDFNQYTVSEVLHQVGGLPDWGQMRYPWVAQAADAGDNRGWQGYLTGKLSQVGDSCEQLLGLSLQTLFQQVKQHQVKQHQVEAYQVEEYQADDTEVSQNTATRNDAVHVASERVKCLTGEQAAINSPKCVESGTKQNHE